MEPFDEWSELFVKFKRDGVLPKRERKRFRELIIILKKQGLLGDENYENIVGGDQGKSEKARGA